MSLEDIQFVCLKKATSQTIRAYAISPCRSNRQLAMSSHLNMSTTSARQNAERHS